MEIVNFIFPHGMDFWHEFFLIVGMIATLNAFRKMIKRLL